MKVILPVPTILNKYEYPSAAFLQGVCVIWCVLFAK